MRNLDHLDRVNCGKKVHRCSYLLLYRRGQYIVETNCPNIYNTGCLITDPSKVEAFYAHLGWNFWVFWTIYSKIILVNLLSNSENCDYVIIGLSADIFSWQFQLTVEFTLLKENYFFWNYKNSIFYNNICMSLWFDNKWSNIILLYMVQNTQKIHSKCA